MFLKYQGKKFDNRGAAALPSVIFLVFLILVIGISISTISFSEIMVSLGSLKSNKALRYAEAGAKDALERIVRNKNYACASPSTGCYQIDFVTSGCSTNDGCARITVSSASNPKVVVSEGRVENYIHRVQVEVTFDSSQNGEITAINWQELTD